MFMIYKLSSIHQKQAIDDGFGEEREAKILCHTFVIVSDCVSDNGYQLLG
jgi:hypothetical protein